MTPKWQKLASLAQEICTFWFQFFGAVFASDGHPFKNIIGFQDRFIIVSCRSKVLQNAQRAFCNTFDHHKATICLGYF